MNQIKVSLILTTYNCKENFATTIETILMQDYPCLEVVVKDGGSTDGTLEAIELAGQQIKAHSGWDFVTVSAPDTGIYDAMNQGYALSTGQVVAFFNDRFTRPDAVRIMVAALQGTTSQKIGAHANLVYADGEKVVRKWRTGEGTIRGGWMPGHPTLFLRREVYEQYGLYDTSYRCSADFEFMVRILDRREQQLAYVDENIISMYYGGTSTNGLKGYLTSIFESQHALTQNHISYIGAWWIIFLRTVRTVFQFL